MAATALLGVLSERLMWGPMRAKQAGFLQLILMSIGLAFVIRSAIQWFWGTEIRTLDVDITDSVTFLGLRIGQTELIVVVVGIAVLVAVGLMLRFTLLGKRMRALSDDLDLAETAGIDTRRVILYTWLFSGALAGLAGCSPARSPTCVLSSASSCCCRSSPRSSSAASATPSAPSPPASCSA